MRDFLSKVLLQVYRLYHFNIYLNYNDVRGITFLRRNLAKLVAFCQGADFRTSGTNIVEKDWRNLIILDGGRRDILEDILETEVSSIISKNSSSLDWLKENFQDEHKDIVMVTGNPYIHKFSDREPEEIFCAVYDAWEYNYDDVFLEPEAVNAALRDAKSKYPDKRFIIHYMQPHFPHENQQDITKDLWNKFRLGERSEEDLRNIYGENYEYVIEKGVLEALQKLEGKTIISADHGQLLGEYGLYGHPSHLKVKELVEVPWIESEKLKDNI